MLVGLSRSGVMLLCASAVLAAASGCASAKHFAGVRLDADGGKLLLVPPVAQSRAYSCGPAATAAVLLYHGVPAAEVKGLLGQAGESAWTAEQIAETVRQAGLDAFFYSGDMSDVERNLDGGRPVLALLCEPPRMARYPDLMWFIETARRMRPRAHWVVAIGWSSTDRMELVLHDSRAGYLTMSRSEWMRVWEPTGRLCVLASPPRAPPMPDESQSQL